MKAKLVFESLDQMFEKEGETKLANVSKTKYDLEKGKTVKLTDKKNNIKEKLVILEKAKKEILAKLAKKPGPIATKKLELDLKGYQTKIDSWKKKLADLK